MIRKVTGEGHSRAHALGQACLYHIFVLWCTTRKDVMLSAGKKNFVQVLSSNAHLGNLSPRIQEHDVHDNVHGAMERESAGRQMGPRPLDPRRRETLPKKQREI